VSSVTQDRDYFSRENPAAVAVDASLKSAIPDRVDPLRGATSSAGRTMINTLVRFLPESVTVGDAVKELAERVRSIPGVMKVQFDELNGRPLTVGGSPVVF
jgi:hypothetical protein